MLVREMYFYSSSNLGNRAEYIFDVIFSPAVSDCYSASIRHPATGRVKLVKIDYCISFIAFPSGITVTTRDHFLFSSEPSN